MAIPPITPYPMPTSAQLRVGPAGWRPTPHRAALLLHDLQGYFLSGFPAGRSPLVDLLGNVGRLRAAATAHGIPVIYTAQPGRMPRADRGLLYDFWGPGMDDTPRSREIAAEVAPGPGDLLLTKRRYSAFHRTGLAAELAQRGRDQLVICGVYAHIGCLLTACDAYAHDVQPFLVADAVADFGQAEHLMALDYAARCCAVTVTTDGVLAALGPTARPR